jgi:ribonuclease-3
MSAAGGAYAKSYQRLEFLGDRVLGLAISDMLLAAYPKASEGDLSRRMSELVRKETCADVAEGWDLGAHLKLGSGEAHSGMRRNRSVLADLCEAVIGAVFLDAGYPGARAVVERGFGARMKASRKPPTNPKASLQEWTLGRGLGTPVYDQVEQTGPDHAPQFRITVAVEGLASAAGQGSSKRAAEQDAARALLVREGMWSTDAEIAADAAALPDDPVQTQQSPLETIDGAGAEGVHVHAGE